MQNAFVYILCSKPHGTLYIGVTANLIQRLNEHRNGGGSEFAKKYGVARLVYYEIHDSIKVAIQRETSLKRWKRDWKVDLINAHNPDWKEIDYTLM
ncbi:MAG: GIY-YIG nuclease family protein [Rhizomicrobium sp.]